MTGWLKGTNGVRPDLVSNGVLGWGSVYGFGVCVVVAYVCACIGSWTTAYGVYVHPGESLSKEPGLSHSCWTEQKDWTVNRLNSEKKKSVNVVTNQKGSCDVTSYPYAILHDHVKAEKQGPRSAGQKVTWIFFVYWIDFIIRLLFICFILILNLKFTGYTSVACHATKHNLECSRPSL